MLKLIFKLISIFGVFSSLSVSAWALPAVDFTAIVALTNCSGSLVRLEGSLGGDQAMILTNGHCLGIPRLLRPGEVWINRPNVRSFGLLDSTGQNTILKLRADLILYATLTDTDMALYRLRETYDEIEAQTGIRALTLSSRHPVAGQPIVIVSGYWKKIFSCSIERFIPELREDQWTWKDSMRYTRPGCDVFGGTSGSPIIDPETHEVIGVNNTGNENGERCTMNNPCEIDESGEITVVPQGSYGEQTFWIYSCLNELYRLDVYQPGCRLPKPEASALRPVLR